MHTQTFSKAHVRARFYHGSFLLVLMACLVFCFNACKKEDNHEAKKGDVVYVLSNDFHDNQNAVLAYRDDGNGKLETLAGSPFYTGGSGVGNPMQALGPLDSDQEIQITADGKFLITVNSGSNTVAVFSIKSDGSLQAVPGSPFSSGGQTPVSIGIANPYVYVVNKSDDPLHASTEAPNYAVFTIAANGALTPLSKSTYETTPGVSPSQALVSRDKKFLFSCDFLGFMQMPAKGTLRSFTINGSGTLNAVSGTPYMIPEMGGALGLWQHPKQNILYVGFPVTGKVGVYTIDAVSGALTFQSAVTSGKAACWLRTNKNGNRLYVLNTAENSVGVLNTSSAASPVLMQNIALKDPGPLYAGPGGAMFPTSQDFSLAFSKNEKYLYVLCQYTNKDFTLGNYNLLHTLKITGDGSLAEETSPVQLPVPATVRPKGLAVH